MGAWRLGRNKGHVLTPPQTPIPLLPPPQVVIFVKSVPRATELNRLLNECNFPSVCIHRGMQQEERIKTYKLFKEGSKRILVATDLVGRGIDIERVNIVINYDMPETDEIHGNGADTYLHRVGGGAHAHMHSGGGRVPCMATGEGGTAEVVP